MTGYTISGDFPATPGAVQGTLGGGTDAFMTLIRTASPIGVTVGRNPSGNSFTVDGVAYTSTQTLSWSPGSTHTIACAVPSGGGVAQCTGWSDGGSISHTVTAPTSAATYTANFVTGTMLDSSAGQISISGSTASPGCAAGSRDFTATVQLQNTSGAAITNPTASIRTLTQGNTLVSQSWDPGTIAPTAIATVTFKITLATCNTFQLYFDLIGH